MTAASTLPGELTLDGDETGTRDRIRSIVITDGPIDAGTLATRLSLTPAGVRRHLVALVSAGEIAERPAPSGVQRGRGRPAREYIATTAAQGHFADASHEVATEALEFIARALGRDGVAQFADDRFADLEATYRPIVDAAGPDVAARTQALAQALSEDGYAASTRKPPGALPVIQLCQGHCPLHSVAREFPELCDAETRLIARLLGVHVQRLATIAGGGHACTTAIPTTAQTTSTPTTNAEDNHA